METSSKQLLDFELDHSGKEEIPRFQAGDTVWGNLKLNIRGRVLLSDIKIRLVCMGEVEWYDDPIFVHAVGSITYPNDRNLCENKHKFLELFYDLTEIKHEKYLSKGQHFIRFHFQLPEQGIPSSFSGEFGSITYTIDVVIHEALSEVLKSDEVEHRMGRKIIVLAPIRQQLDVSVGGTTEKDFGIISLGSGKIKFAANVTKKGFVPGENLELNCNIENNSSVNVTPRATINKKEIYLCGTRHKCVGKHLTDEPVFGQKVEKHSNTNQRISLKIPDDIPLSMKSELITVKYIIHVTLDIPHAIDVHLNIPIIITNDVKK